LGDISLENLIKELEKEWMVSSNPEESEFPVHSKIYHDPIYGTIKLNPAIIFLIDLPCFQRLRRIKQLGFADLVFPGAHHNRFEHSIGTYYLSQFFLRCLYENNEIVRKNISSETPLELQIAALLHDVGHLPFSHVTESLLYANDEVKKTLDSQGLKGIKPHELLSSEIIKGKYITKAIERINKENGVGLKSSSISQLVLGKPHGLNKNNHFLGQILHGSIDVDRIDYLCRDGYYTGVPFGKVDYGRLAQTLTINEDGVTGKLDLATEYRGIEAVEGLLVSRTLMYSSVYYHHTAIASSSLLSRTAMKYLKKSGISPLYLMNLDDNLLMTKLKDHKDCFDCVKRIENRQLPKISVNLKPKNITDFLTFESFMEDMSLETLIDIESEIGNDIIINIPKYREYEEIHTHIKEKGSTKPITHYSKIIKGISDNADFGWSGYIFSPNNESRESIAKIASDYFKTHTIGLTI